MSPHMNIAIHTIVPFYTHNKSLKITLYTCDEDCDCLVCVFNEEYMRMKFMKVLDSGSVTIMAITLVSCA